MPKDKTTHPNRPLPERMREAVEGLDEAYGRLVELVEESMGGLEGPLPPVQEHVFIADREFRVLYASGFGSEALSAAAARVTGKTVDEALPPSTARVAKSQMSATFESGRPQYGRHDVELPEGDVSVETWMFPLRDEMGEAAQVFGVVRDVTEQARAERQAVAESARLSNVLGIMPACAYVLEGDPDAPPGRLVPTFVSAAMHALLGYEPEETLTEPGWWVNHIHPDDRDETIQRQNALFEGRTVEREYRIRHKDDSYRWIQDRAVLVRDGGLQRVVGVFIDVTERKEARRALRETEERLRTAVEAVGLDCWFLDDHCQLVEYYAGKITHRLGYTVEELRSYAPEERPWETPESTRIIDKALSDAYAGIPSYDVEVPRIARDGSTVWMSQSVAPVLDERGKVVGVAGYATDITERKQAEESLRESEERYGNLIEALGVDCWVLDSEREIVHFELGEVGRRLGYSLEEMTDCPATQRPWETPEGKRTMDDALNRAYKGEASYNLELPAVSRDGQTVWVSHAVAPLCDREGNVVGVAGFGIDITERKLAEEALRESEERLRAIADYSYDWEVWVGPDGALLWTCPAAERVTGYTPEELITMPDYPMPLVCAEDAELVREAYARAVAGSTESDIEHRLVRKDGRVIWVSTSAQPIFSAAGKHIGLRASIREITERKLAEEALRRSEREKEGILDSTEDGIIYHDKDLRIAWANSTAAQSAGLTVEEMVRDHCYRIWHGRAEPCEGCPVQITLDTGRPARAEMRTPDGHVWWVRGYPVLDEDGQVTGAVEAVLDITERKRAEEALRASEERLRMALDAAEMGTWRWVAQTRHVTRDASFNRILGLPAEASTTPPQEFTKRVHPDDVEHVREAIRTATRDHTPFLMEFRVKRPDGEIRWLRDKGRAYYDDDGKRTHMTGVVLDITERKEAEEALRHTLERYRVLFESTPVSLWEEDFSAVRQYADRLRASGVEDVRAYLDKNRDEVWACAERVGVVRVNETTLRMYEAETTQDFVDGLKTVFTEDTWDVFRDEIAAIADGRTTFEGEALTRSLRGKPIPIAVHWVTLPGSEETYERVLVSAVDLTERKRMEEQLRQAQKMEAVGRLAGGIAHDFNTRLSVITGYCDVLLGQIGEDDAAQESVMEILRSAEAASELTGDLLTFSRKLPSANRTIDLRELIERIEGPIESMLGEGVKLSIETGQNLWRVVGDPVQIEQSIMNLVSNARDAMTDGGRLSIEVWNDQGGRAPSGVRAGPHIDLVFRDTGCGMDQETAQRAFEPFFTTKDLGKGTGLGLALVYEIVRQMGGEVEIASTPGEGTVVTVHLPRANGPQ